MPVIWMLRWAAQTCDKENNGYSNHFRAQGQLDFEWPTTSASKCNTGGVISTIQLLPKNGITFLLHKKPPKKNTDEEWDAIKRVFFISDAIEVVNHVPNDFTKPGTKQWLWKRKKLWKHIQAKKNSFPHGGMCVSKIIDVLEGEG